MQITKEQFKELGFDVRYKKTYRYTVNETINNNDCGYIHTDLTQLFYYPEHQTFKLVVGTGDPITCYNPECEESIEMEYVDFVIFTPNINNYDELKHYVDLLKKLLEFDND